MSLKVVTLNYDSYDKIVDMINKENDEIAKIIEKVIKIEQNENIFMGRAANEFKNKMTKFREKLFEISQNNESYVKLITTYTSNQLALLGPNRSSDDMLASNINSTVLNECINEDIIATLGTLTSAIRDNTEEDPHYDKFLKDHHCIGEREITNNLTYLNELKDNLTHYSKLQINLYDAIKFNQSTYIKPFTDYDNKFIWKNVDNLVEDMGMGVKLIYDVGKGIWQAVVQDPIDAMSGALKIIQLLWIEHNGTKIQKEKYKNEINENKKVLTAIWNTIQRLGLAATLGYAMGVGPAILIASIAVDVIQNMHETFDKDVKTNGLTFALSHVAGSLILVKGVGIVNKSKVGLIGKFAKAGEAAEWLNPEKVAGKALGTKWGKKLTEKAKQALINDVANNSLYKPYLEQIKEQKEVYKKTGKEIYNKFKTKLESNERYKNFKNGAKSLINEKIGEQQISNTNKRLKLLFDDSVKETKNYYKEKLSIKEFPSAEIKDQKKEDEKKEQEGNK